MDWLELKIDTSHAGLDAVTDMLEQQGVTGVMIDDEADFQSFLENNRQYWDYVDDDLLAQKKGVSRVTFYLERNEDAYGTVAAVRMAMSALKKDHPEYAPLLLTMADVAAPALALGQAVGRWGNFVNQEAYGVPVTTPALQWFPLAVYIEREGGWFAATFFYESAWCFLICALILVFERTRLFARPGRATLFYVFMYAAERTVVEGLRMDSLYLGSVRVSQALSALLLLAAALLLCLRLPRRRKWLLIPTLAAIPLFFLSPLAYALLLLAVCLVCYEMTPRRSAS